jgi:hypothetical protein
MSVSKPVERVVQLLAANEYVHLGEYLNVGSVRFDFSAVLVGARRASDLIVVADTLDGPTDSHLRRAIAALARALDLAESRRSMTLIVVGPRPSEISLRELARVSRILLVGTPTGDSADESIRGTLAVLLPLDLPVGGATTSSPLELVRAQLPEIDPSILDAFFVAAPSGTESVRAALRNEILTSISEAR